MLYKGKSYSIMLSARENRTTITDMEGVFAAIGTTKFLENCTFTLSKLADLLPLQVREKLCKTQRTGTRTVTPFKQ